MSEAPFQKPADEPKPAAAPTVKQGTPPVPSESTGTSSVEEAAPAAVKVQLSPDFDLAGGETANVSVPGSGEADIQLKPGVPVEVSPQFATLLTEDGTGVVEVVS